MANYIKGLTEEQSKFLTYFTVQNSVYHPDDKTFRDQENGLHDCMNLSKEIYTLWEFLLFVTNRLSYEFPSFNDKKIEDIIDRINIWLGIVDRFEITFRYVSKTYVSKEIEASNQDINMWKGSATRYNAELAEYKKSAISKIL